MSSVLIVTRDFTPYCGQTGWMIRAVSMANFLADQGFDVTVVAALRSQKAASLYLNPKVKVYWVHDIFEYYKYDHRAWIRIPFVAVGIALVRVLKIIRVPVFDRTMLSLYFYKKKIRALCANNKIKNIILTTPPHSLQTLAVWIKNEMPDINLISDFRDAWSLRPMYGESKWLINKIEPMEQLVFSKANHVLLVSEGMHQLYQQKFAAKNLVTVENGFLDVEIGSVSPDFSEVVNRYRSEGKIILGYFGSGSVGQSHEKDIAILLETIACNTGLVDRFAVIIQGQIVVNSFFKTAASYSLFEPASHADVMAHMRLVDFGVNLFNVPDKYAPAVIAGKTYEYIYNSMPILVVAPKNAYSLKEIINDVGGYFADINDKENIKSVLKKVASDHFSNDGQKLIITNEKRAKYSRKYQYQKISRILVS